MPVGQKLLVYPVYIYSAGQKYCINCIFSDFDYRSATMMQNSDLSINKS